MKLINQILYVQYTNPAAYPPLEHSSRILADRGWRVTFLGTGASGQADSFYFPPHANIKVKKLPFSPPGLRQKLQFLMFCLWILREARRMRAQWIYASDALACPAAIIASRFTGCRVAYHEHDSPPSATTNFQKLVLTCRRRLAALAQVIVLPNVNRIRVFKRETSTTRPVFCVWNCPERHEVVTPAATVNAGTVLFFHGSLNAARLPFSILHALENLPSVSLQFAGYVTTGNPTFVADYLAEAKRKGVEDRVVYLGASASREQLLEHCRRATIGLAFIAGPSDDLNMREMTGASNKPFDYLASGLALLVSDLPDWTSMFVEPGYGRACNPADPSSIERAVRWFVEHPEQTRKMGERGRQKILAEWNYESQFAPVLAELEGSR